MSDQKILARVRKLLALANNSAASEGERDNALRMAHATLAKHNLEMIDLERAGTAQAERRTEHTAALVVYPWARTVAMAVGDLFFCDYYFTRPTRGKIGTHHFVGRESNATTAAEMVAYLITSILRESRKLYGSETSPDACAFDKGAASRIYQRVQELLQPAKQEAAHGAQNALVLADFYKTEQAANAAWLVASGVTTVTVPDRQKWTGNASAYNNGRRYGGSLSLNNQVADKASALPRIK